MRIQFACTHCARVLAVNAELGGRRGRCRYCGTVLTIPLRSEAFRAATAEQNVSSATGPAVEPTRTRPTTAPVAGSPPLPPRTRRLLSDAQQMRRAFQNFEPIRIIASEGAPPTTYTIEYRLQGLARGAGGVPIPQQRHLVEIRLTHDYPRQSPHCRVVTPIFHPNIEPASICIGDHWTAAERLTGLVVRIGEMIAYQSYNIKSPLDGEAAMWADLHRDRLPLDSRDLHPPDLD